MPTVEVDPDHLRELTGHEDIDDEQLKTDLFGLGLEFEGITEEGAFELEFGPDRLDRLSVEGIARSLRYQYGDARGVHVPGTNDAEWTIMVEESVPTERPCITGAVVRDVSLDGAALESLIQLQEKLHATMGRDRAKGAIGVHDLTMLRGSPATQDRPTVRYVGIGGDDDRFVPLESDAELTPAAVLEDHHIGQKYADLVDDYEAFPAIYDDIGLFSFPPVVNGRRTEVSTDSRDLFIEMTGTDQWTIDKMLVIVCYALTARGGTVEAVTIEYPNQSLDRPDLSTKTKRVTHDRIESVLGIHLDGETVVDLIERSGLEATTDETDDGLEYTVTVPPYRVDVWHPRDVIDDVGRAFGFNDLNPTYPAVGTVGGRHERSRLEEAVRTQLIGLGFEDLLNFHLINESELFNRMRLDLPSEAVGAREPVTITEPYSEAYTTLRTWVLPSLVMVLENNTHRSYPQDLAEIGFTAAVDEDQPTNVLERRHVAGVLASNAVGYEDAKARLQALARNFDCDLTTPASSHPSFIDGRTAAVAVDGEKVGVVGELHPEVLVEHDLEVPVAGFEFELQAFGSAGD